MLTVGIAGVGLIGGSLGMALRRVRRAGKRVYRVGGWGRAESRLRKARRFGALDFFSTRPQNIVPEVDILVLCVPVQDMAAALKRALPLLKKGSIVTDVGSVKQSVLKDLGRILTRRKDVTLVGGHPLAGSEKAGIQFAKPDLFVGAKVVLASRLGSKKGVKVVQALWKDVGAEGLLLNPARHDEILALTSHLPHLLAFALFSLASRTSQTRPALKSLVAGSFRDMTRIAASDPHIWTGIIEANRVPLSRQARRFRKILDGLISAPSSRLEAKLHRLSRQKKQWSA